MTLTTPVWLLCSAVGIALPLLARRGRVSRKHFGERFADLSLALFALTLVLLGLVLAGVRLQSTEERTDIVALIDISESLDETLGERLFSRIADYSKAGVAVGVVPFSGTTASAAVPFTDYSSYARLRAAFQRLNVGSSNLEDALVNAAASGAASVVLLSDGRETEGSAKSAVERLREAGVKLFPLTDPSLSAPGIPFSIVNLHAPLVAAAQKSVEIRAALRNGTTAPQSGTLTITHDQKQVYAKSVTVTPGEELLVLAPSDPSQEGTKEIVATLTPDDRSLPPSVARIFLSGQRRERVLLVSSSADDERFLAETLNGQAYQLKTMIAGQQTDLFKDLSSTSAVILNNVPYALLPPGASRQLEEYVRGGGGLLMVGGNRSFGLGGYIGTPIEPLLPVELLPPQTVKKRLSVAVQLLIDKSGSMETDSRLEFAKEGAREVLRNLKDEDFFGVIGFDSTPFIAFPMSQVGPNRARADQRVGQLFPKGKTQLLEALDEGRRGLSRVNAGRKHVIAITDGKLPDAGPLYFELTEQMRILGITLSTVLIGTEGDDGFLKQLADVGGGGFYTTRDPRNLARIFIQDVKVSTGERTLREDLEYLVRPGTAPLTSTTVRSFPPLRGYVQTKPKARAALELVVMAEEKAEPLLASWAIEKGRVTAFTSDATGRWSNFWIQWPRFSTFWSELLDSLRPAGEKLEDSTRFDLRTVVERGVLRLDATLFSQQLPGTLSAVLEAPDGKTSTVTLSQVATGRYAVDVAGVTAGKYTVRLTSSNRELTPVSFYLAGELFGEQKGAGVNVPLLSSLAAATGGVLDPSPEQISGARRSITTSIDPSPWFFAAAALCMVLAILWREVFASRVAPRRRATKRQAQPVSLPR